MSPLDDELRSLFQSRADVLAPAAEPLRGIERRARRMRRNRVAASVAGTVLAVAAVAVAVPALLPHNVADRDNIVPATATPSPEPSSEPSPSVSPSTAPVAVGALDPQHPWTYRGDPAVLSNGNLQTFQRDWAAAHPGSTLAPLFGQVYEPSRRPQVVFVATGGAGDRWGIVTTSDAGSTFLHDEQLAAGTKVLMAALSGDEVPRLVIVAAPNTGQISYARDGVSFHALVGPDAGIAFSPLEGDTSRDAVQVLDGDGNLDAPVFQGPAPDPAVAGPATTPVNLLNWMARGATPDPKLLYRATAAFAKAVGAPLADVHSKVLYAGTDRAGQDFVFGEAWVTGQDAHTFGLISTNNTGGEPFLGPVIGKEPALLAFLVPAAPGVATDSLILLPQPGVGTVSYAPSGTAPYRIVASGRSDLNPTATVDRDPRATTDRVDVLAGDGSPLFHGPVMTLLCGASGCG